MLHSLMEPPKPHIFNQTMYEVFFSSIGILMGFIQAEFFQLSRLYKEEEIRHRNYMFVFVATFVIQELLLSCFIFSLVYIYYYGSYVLRMPGDPEYLVNSFVNNIFYSERKVNVLILLCICSLLIINFFLFHRQLTTLKNSEFLNLMVYKITSVTISIITVIVVVALFCFLWNVFKSEPIYYQETSWQIFPTSTIKN